MGGTRSFFRFSHAGIAGAILNSVSPLSSSEHERGEQRDEGEQECQRAEARDDHIQEEPGDMEVEDGEKDEDDAGIEDDERDGVVMSMRMIMVMS